MGIRVFKAEVWQQDLQLMRSYRIAGQDFSVAESAFIVIRDDKDHFGIGAASPMPKICDERMEDTITALKKASDVLHMADITTPEQILKKLEQELSATPAAMAAVDMAIYDLYCKVKGVPLVEYLGRKYLEMETSVTIGIMHEEQAREQLRLHLQNGFRIIKVKIGDDVERDISIIHKLREWGGGQFRLRVDANQGYDLTALGRFLKAVEHLNIELIEQPFPVPGSALMRTLPSSERLRCMADEDLLTQEEASSLVRDQSYGVWNIKLMKTGGITPGRRMADMASQAGIEVMWGCNDESRVSIAAALHAAFSSPATRYLDLDGAFDIARDIAQGGYVVEKGMMRLTDATGLGITLD